MVSSHAWGPKSTSESPKTPPARASVRTQTHTWPLHTKPKPFYSTRDPSGRRPGAAKGGRANVRPGRHYWGQAWPLTHGGASSGITWPSARGTLEVQAAAQALQGHGPRAHGACSTGCAPRLVDLRKGIRKLLLPSFPKWRRQGRPKSDTLPIGGVPWHPFDKHLLTLIQDFSADLLLFFTLKTTKK